MQAGKFKLTLIYVVLLTVTSLYFHSLHASTQNDFNAICEIFTEAENSSFTNEQKSDYIDNNVK